LLSLELANLADTCVYHGCGSRADLWQTIPVADRSAKISALRTSSNARRLLFAAGLLIDTHAKCSSCCTPCRLSPSSRSPPSSLNPVVPSSSGSCKIALALSLCPLISLLRWVSLTHECPYFQSLPRYKGLEDCGRGSSNWFRLQLQTPTRIPNRWVDQMGSRNPPQIRP
jgi:hypothetical protein